MLLRILKKISLSSKKKEFQKNAVLGTNIQFSYSSGCVNMGRKEDITIGNHGCCFCLLQALYGGKIEIGNNFYIGTGTVLQSKEKIIIGNNVIISNNVLIVDNNNHPVSPKKRVKMSLCYDYMNDPLWTWKDAISKPIIIEDNTWIGRDSVIMKGVTIGKGSVVALRSVVTHDVPPFTVVAGNPARVVKKIVSEEE